MKGFPLLYLPQNIEYLQAAGGQHDKLGASFQIFPEFLQRDEAYKYSKESLGSLSKESVKVKNWFPVSYTSSYNTKLV
jgi:hypothetical protein